MLEVERKYRLPISDEAKDILEKIRSFTLMSTVEEHDWHGMVNDKYMRIREIKSLNGDGVAPVYHLIYKGQAVQFRSEKARKEIEIEIPREQVDDFIQILSGLTTQPLPKVTKIRLYYKMEDVTVTLDQVQDLGLFVEVELLGYNPDWIRLNKIADVLGLRREWLVDRSYGELLKEKEDKEKEG